MTRDLKSKLTGDLKSKLTGDLLFFISYGLFLVTSILNASFFYKYFVGKPYMRIQSLCIFLLLIYEICSNGWRKQNWLGLLVCTVLGWITIRVSPAYAQRQVVWMFAYIYSARNIPFAKIARFTLNASIAVVLAVVVSSFFGVVESIAAYKNGRIREYLGFRYALYLPGLLLNMTALWVYVKKDTITVTGTLVWAVANVLVFWLTDSRISFFIAEALLAAGLLMRYFPKVLDKLKVIWALAAGSFALCTVFSLLITVLYDSSLPWMRKLNSMLESRLRLGHASLQEFGVKWFGQEILWLGNGLDAYGNSTVGTYNYVDCMYVKILQRYGIVFVVLWLAMICWGMYRMYKRKEYHILLISATVAAHCVLDDLSLTLHYNTFWMALGVILMNPKMLDWNGKTTQIAPKLEPQNE